MSSKRLRKRKLREIRVPIREDAKDHKKGNMCASSFSQ